MICQARIVRRVSISLDLISLLAYHMHICKRFFILLVYPSSAALFNLVMRVFQKFNNKLLNNLFTIDQLWSDLAPFLQHLKPFLNENWGEMQITCWIWIQRSLKYTICDKVSPKLNPNYRFLSKSFFTVCLAKTIPWLILSRI